MIDEYKQEPDFEEGDEDEEYYDSLYDDMDGDHDSAMQSVGWGTDEDYGYFGGDE
jgi:hypothetical protein